MNKKHEKSACCRANSIKYGKRRRQCTSCRRTWSVWLHKRGRKRKRTNLLLVTAFLGREIASLAALARKRSCSEAHIQARLQKSRDQFIELTSWSPIPDGDLLLIADAVVEFIEHRWHTLYLMLVRPVAERKAIILPPIILSGTELAPGWKIALESIPEAVRNRVVALVSDGHNGLITEGARREWILQRCHFHLIARVQSRRSRFATARNREEAKEIFQLINHILSHPDMPAIQPALVRLGEISKNSTSPEIRKVLSGFITNHNQYRSYLMYPELNLPTTNNTAESLASTVADLKQRMRGFPTLRSFQQWVIALLKFKKAVMCNGHHQQNKLG